MSLLKISHTVLYGLEPQRPCTMHAESLRSYLARLALAHSISTRQLVHRVLSQDLPAGIAIALLGVSLQKRVLGPSKAARLASSLLVKLTGREALRWTTLGSLIGHLTGSQLFTKVNRHCRKCFDEDVEQGRPTYERLLWSIELAKCCPVHGYTLEKPSCGREAHVRSNRRLVSRVPGVCPDCGAIAYSCVKVAAEPALQGDIERARQIAGLVESLPQVEESSLKETKARYYAAVKKDRATHRLAAAANLTPVTLSNWLRTDRRFCLARWLSLAEATESSLSDLMLGKADLQIKAVAETRAKQKFVFPVERTGEIREALIRSAREGRSFHATCRELDLHWSLVRAKFPVERHLVTSATNERRKNLYLVALGEAMLMAEQLLKDRLDLQLRNLVSNGVRWGWSERRTVVFMQLRSSLGYSAPDFAYENKFSYIQEELAAAKCRLQELARQA